MNGQTLYRETSYLRAFPDAADVFASRVKEHAEYLLPVATLSLKHLSRKWDGVIHFVMPIEPCGGYGYSGDESKPYHNYLCRPNWIGYRMVGNKLELACDVRYFHKAYYVENPPQSETRKQEVEQLESHYRRTRQEFKRRAEFFKKHGWLCQSPDQWPGLKKEEEWMRASLVRDLGGVSFGGNWSSSRDFPISRYPDQFEDLGKLYDSERVLPLP